MQLPRVPAASSLALGGAAAVTALAAAAASAAGRRTFTPRTFGQPTQLNEQLLRLCPSLTAPYTLPALLSNGHVETISAAWFRRSPPRHGGGGEGLLYDRELLRMPDGGVVALDVEDLPPEAALPASAPLLVLLPGLTGGSDDTYVQWAVVHARAAGVRAVVFNSRGTAGSPVETAQFYSASHTGDLRAVVAHVRARWPAAGPLFAAGWSLGANILVRYLGEEGAAAPVAAAVSMCNPWDLPRCDANFRVGFNRAYDANLARSLARIFRRHAPLFAAAAAAGGARRAYDVRRAAAARTVREFDEAVTAPCFGWPSVDAYYAGSSSAADAGRVAVPLLVVAAADDPIAPAAALPEAALAANANVLGVVTPSGGHLGWCGGAGGPFGAPQTDAMVAEYLRAMLKLHRGEARAAAPAEEMAGVSSLGEERHQAP